MILFGSWMERAGYEMDGGGSRQVSIDVTNTFDNLLLIWSRWKQFICHWSNQCVAIRWCNCSLLLNHPWTCSKEKEWFRDSLRSLGLCIPLIATSAAFSFGGGSDFKFERSSPLLDKYICATAAIGARHFCLQMAQFWALLDIHVDWELVSIMVIFILLQKLFLRYKNQ